jgi:hypothetical protein
VDGSPPCGIGPEAARSDAMVKIGYKLMMEEHGPAARKYVEAGFDPMVLVARDPTRPGYRLFSRKS